MSLAPRFRHSDPSTPVERWRGDPRWAGSPALALPPDRRRLIVLAAHPDDETLGAAGLIATAADRGYRVEVLLASAGEASHPDSPTHTPEDLARRRLNEAREALGALAPGAGLHLLDEPDGRLAAAEERLGHRLVELLGDGRDAVLVSSWRHDGHPDHEACGRAARVAARRTGATWWQFPIWWWHWGEPDRLPWDRLRRLPIGPTAHARKRAAIAAHRTQIAPLSDQPGDEVLLSPDFLAHFAGTEEVFLTEPADDPALDDLHRDQDDPWSTRRSWYERRKRAMTLATLPRERYGRGLEVGCSIGALAADLSARCGHVTAVDASPTAVDLARTRLATVANAVVTCCEVPQEWPAGPFDLVVVSETGYYLSPADLDALAERITGSLLPGGDVVLCHWRHPIEGWPLDGPEVHRRLSRALPHHEVATYREHQVEIMVLSGAPLVGPAR